MAAARVFLVHWHEAEAAERAQRLRSLGYEVDYGFATGGEPCRAIGADPPAVVVIDLDRLPSHGRHTGLTLRERRKTRHVPLVFVGGQRDKIATVQQALPDATFTTWKGIGKALAAARRRQPEQPVVPSTTHGYSGTPLPRKLGIGPGTVVAALGAPPSLETILGDLPDGVRLSSRIGAATDVVLLFARTRAELQRRLAAAAARLPPRAALWVSWPKQASPLHRDIDGNDVRRAGLATGLVDTKVCAVDGDWSGLRFSHRRR